MPVSSTGLRLKDKLEDGQFVFTAEITPPVSFDRDDLVKLAAPLRGLADAVNLTDGAGARAHVSALAAAAVLIGMDIEPVLQMVCRDRNRIALQNDLMAAAMLGMRSLLILRGDNPATGDQPEAKPVFDLDPIGLMEAARRMRDHKELLNGRRVAGYAQFFIGAADMPIDPPADWKPEALIAKKAAGAQFVQTQFCMDVEILRRYMAHLTDYHLPDHLYFIVGISPLKSARSARWMRDRLFGTIIPDHLIERMESAAEPEAEGRRIALELIEEFRNIRGVAGVHLMAPGNEEAIPKVISAIRR